MVEREGRVERAERQSESPNFYDISDYILGFLTSRLEWHEAQISVGTPYQHTVAISDSLPHQSQPIGLDILMQ